MFPLCEDTNPEKENTVYFFPGLLWLQVLHLSLLSHLSSLLHMVWIKNLTWLFCIQLSSLPNTIYWRGFLFSVEYSCILCHRLIDHIIMDSFLDHLFYSIGLCVCFWATTVFFLFKTVLFDWGILCFHTNFRIIYSISMKKHWYFHMFCFECVDLLNVWISF